MPWGAPVVPGLFQSRSPALPAPPATRGRAARRRARARRHEGSSGTCQFRGLRDTVVGGCLRGNSPHGGPRARRFGGAGDGCATQGVRVRQTLGQASGTGHRPAWGPVPNRAFGPWGRVPARGLGAEPPGPQVFGARGGSLAEDWKGAERASASSCAQSRPIPLSSAFSRRRERARGWGPHPTGSYLPALRERGSTRRIAKPEIRAVRGRARRLFWLQKSTANAGPRGPTDPRDLARRDLRLGEHGARRQKGEGNVTHAGLRPLPGSTCSTCPAAAGAVDGRRSGPDGAACL